MSIMSARWKQIATRFAACAVTLALVSCQIPMGTTAFAAEDKSSAKTSSLSAGKNDEKKDDKNGDKKDDAERKEKEEQAQQKHEEADKLFAQADAMNATLAQVQAERDAAERDLELATSSRDEANLRLAEEVERLSSLQAELSEFVIGMYKRGGVTPYLDVLLRSTSYQEFLTSWVTLVAVYEQGEALAEERRVLQKEIESELAACEEQITQAERSIAVADSKLKQIQASQLALTAQACDIEVEAAEIIGDKDEVAKAKEAAESAREALEEAIGQGLAGESLIIGDGIFAHPCPGSTVSSTFGYREFDHAAHKGLDLAAPEGTPYYAADSGTVTAATNGGGYNGGAGNWIVIDHGNGFVTKYMHSLVTFVQVGDHVERGQNIGLVGTTGNSTGPHLHFQVEANGVAVDPAPFLQKQESE